MRNINRMSALLALGACFAVTAARAESNLWTLIPPPVHAPQALFTPSKSPPGHLETKASGARLVVEQNALVVGAGDTGITLQPSADATPPSMALERGGVHIRVGKGLQLRLGDLLFELRASDVYWVAVRHGWLLLVQPEQTNDIPVSPETTEAQIPYGRALFVPFSGAPSAASKTQEETLLKLERAVAATPQKPPLVYAPLEDPADRAVRATNDDNLGEAIEIEAIEVEAGCVEICVD